jgi:hypothetical protein
MLVIFDDERAWQVGNGSERAMPIERSTTWPTPMMQCEVIDPVDGASATPESTTHVDGAADTPPGTSTNN